MNHPIQYAPTLRSNGRRTGLSSKYGIMPSDSCEKKQCENGCSTKLGLCLMGCNGDDGCATQCERGYDKCVYGCQGQFAQSITSNKAFARASSAPEKEIYARKTKEMRARLGIKGFD